MMDWTKKINMVMVRYAKKLLSNPLIKSTNISLGIPLDKNYIISDVCVSGYSVNDKKDDKGIAVDKGAVFFYLDNNELIQLGKSFYPPIRFSIPKSQLLEFETDETHIPQTITITEWGYKNCVETTYNRVLEDWGRRMSAMFKYYESDAWDNAPMYKYSPYRAIIEQIKKKEVSDMVKDYVKKNRNDNKPKMVQQKHVEDDVREETKPSISNNNENNGNNNTIKKNKKVNNKKIEPFRDEAQWVFYVDGSGNLANDNKTKDMGHFSVYLKNTEEKWKRREDRLTNNQAEIKGVMAAIIIAEKKGFKNVRIYTDSQNVINWCTRKKDKPDEWVWAAKSPNIVSLVDKLREMLSIIPQLDIRHVPRERNWAHGV